jgi:hypothetical protein
MASMERTSKKKRLMTEVKFDNWEVLTDLRYPEEGIRPNFALVANKQYTSTGTEKQVKKTP